MHLAKRVLMGVVIGSLCCGSLQAEESKSWWPFKSREETSLPPVATAPPFATQTVTASPPVTAAPSAAVTAPATPPTTTTTAAEPETWLKWPSMPEMKWPTAGKDETTTVVAQAPVAPAPVAPAPPAMSTASTPSASTAATTPVLTPDPTITPIPPEQPRRRPFGFGKAGQQEARKNTWANKEPDPNAPAVSPWQSVKNGAKRVGNSTASAWHKTVDVVTPGDGSTQAAPTAVAQQEPKHHWWSWWRGDKEEPQGPQTVTEWMAQERLDP
jgi:hypothetical protein